MKTRIKSLLLCLGHKAANMQVEWAKAIRQIFIFRTLAQFAKLGAFLVDRAATLVGDCGADWKRARTAEPGLF